MSIVPPACSVYVASASSGVDCRVGRLCSGFRSFDKCGKVNTPCRMSKMALLLFKKQSPIRGLGKTFITMKYPLNIKSVTSNVRRTVLYWRFQLPVCYHYLTIGCGTYVCFVSGARSLILFRSCSDIALVRSPVSIRMSSVSFSKSIGKYYIWRLLFSVRLVDRRSIGISVSLLIVR